MNVNNFLTTLRNFLTELSEENTQKIVVYNKRYLNIRYRLDSGTDGVVYIVLTLKIMISNI